MRKMKICELVLDYDLYPRNSVDSHNVNMLKEAISAGAELPPVVIDKASKRVVDGFHRIKAYLAILGQDASITVAEKSYPSDKALFLDAMRYNAAHGAKLDSHDRTRCILICERLSVDPIDTAAALHMTVDKLAVLRVDRTALGNERLTVPIKRTLHHLRGQQLTARQVEANAKLSGMNQQFYVNQVIELIEADALDDSDDELMKRLTVLRGLLNKLLAKGRAA